MKNFIKIITIFGMVAFFPVYSMVLSGFREDMIDSTELTNPLLDMSGFYTRKSVQHRWQSTPDDDPLHTDEGLALILTAIEILAERDREKNEKTLRKVCDAIRAGKPVTSKYTTRSKEHSIFVYVFPSQNSTSIFTSIENLFEHPPSLTNTDNRKVDKKRLWMNTIFQGHRERKKRLKYICGKLEENKIPKDLEHEFLSYLPAYNVSEESTKLIEQAKQKFDEE